MRGRGLVVGLFLVTVAAWLGLEIYLVASSQPTISEDVQKFFRVFPPVGVLAGYAMGWFSCHFFS